MHGGFHPSNMNSFHVSHSAELRANFIGEQRVKRLIMLSHGRNENQSLQLRLTSGGQLAIEKLRCCLVGADPIAPAKQVVDFVGDD